MNRRPHGECFEGSCDSPQNWGQSPIRGDAADPNNQLLAELGSDPKSATACASAGAPSRTKHPGVGFQGLQRRYRHGDFGVTVETPLTERPRTEPLRNWGCGASWCATTRRRCWHNCTPCEGKETGQAGLWTVSRVRCKRLLQHLR